MVQRPRSKVQGLRSIVQATSSVQRQLLKYLMKPPISFLTGHGVTILHHSSRQFLVFHALLITARRHLDAPRIKYGAGLGEVENQGHFTGQAY